jgi:hypothetical protein
LRPRSAEQRVRLTALAQGPRECEITRHFYDRGWNAGAEAAAEVAEKYGDVRIRDAILRLFKLVDHADYK